MSLCLPAFYCVLLTESSIQMKLRNYWQSFLKNPRVTENTHDFGGALRCMVVKS